MRFVAHALDQAQGRRVVREYKRGFLPGKEKAFLPCPAIRPFRDAHHRKVGHTHPRECRHGRMQLAQSTVDQQQVGHRRLATHHPGEAALDRLFDAGVIVARRDVVQ